MDPVSNKIAINPQSGEITLSSPLDYEKTTKLTLNITAKDYGSTPKSSSTSVKISVTDINDETPKFNLSTYHKNVSEDINGMCEIAAI